jgi:hypothetical protein
MVNYEAKIAALKETYDLDAILDPDIEIRYETRKGIAP